ncbi:hypothetical protein CHS0354_037282 [Potamilus streckersoni]|uniref:Antistasin-like domain-containing protein n=1 Tax=Potamilus streckersoni TaxID=2493646 RepID=A0AAE0SX18_9BIVA|nr:hypothetical protein CHS0354_037282 [Potamilus streckersoni]
MDDMFTRVLLLTLLLASTYGQFPNFFASLMKGTGNNCMIGSVSCLPAPWCRRIVDESGCAKCDCSQMESKASENLEIFKRSLFHPSSPLSGELLGALGDYQRGQISLMGLSQMYGAQVNPMASVLGGSSLFNGGMGPGTPPVQNVNSSCDTAPYTCVVPPPWCQRVVDQQGCVKCLCGQELQLYLQNLQGVASGTSQPSGFLSTSTATPRPNSSTTSPVGTSCLATFSCTKICDNGYVTDSDDCPVCQCINDQTPPHNQQTSSHPPVTFITPSSNHVISCPGIFDCDKMCDRGYVTDPSGCPLCQCMT